MRHYEGPRLLGREAFCHDHEGIGPPRMASKDDLITESNSPGDMVGGASPESI